MRSFRIVLLVIIALALMGTPAMAKKKKRKKKGAEDAPPPVGEVMIGEWKCYGPPDWAPMNTGQLRMARSDALIYLQDFVTGKVMEGFELQGESLEYFETAFLGRPQLLDPWLQINFEWCEAVGKGKKKPSEYLAYLSEIGRELEAGQCYKPLSYEYHNFLEVAAEWQFRLHVCEGDRLLIESTGKENGQYTISDTGRMKDNVFITSEGDPNMPEAGELGPVPELPHGALVMRFEAEDGSYTKYVKVGMQLKWEAPEHGYISFTVNDLTYFDNKFRDMKGAIDYLGLDIYPPVDQEDVP
jgi:hypothetical protein